MAVKVVVGHVKVVDDEGNVLDAGISLTDLYNTFTEILVEIKKVNMQLAFLNELEVKMEDDE